MENKCAQITNKMLHIISCFQDESTKNTILRLKPTSRRCIQFSLLTHSPDFDDFKLV